MKQKTALITGITGQDGAYLAQLLLTHNYTVIGTVRDINNIYDFNLNLLNIKTKIQLIETDLTKEDNFATLIAENKVNEIYHLAAQSSVGKSFIYPYETLRDNFKITANLLEQVRCSNNNIKFYNSVSSEIFGNQKMLPITESSTVNPISPYGLSKSFSFQLGKLYRNLYNQFICNGILFNHESELRRGNFFINKIINTCYNISTGKTDKLLLGNVNIKRDFGYAPKFVEAMYLMMQQSAADDYVVCSGKSILLSDIVNYIINKFKLDSSVIEIDQNLIRPDEIYEIYGDNSKIRSLGWEYEQNFFSIIDQIINFKLAHHAM